VHLLEVIVVAAVVPELAVLQMDDVRHNLQRGGQTNRGGDRRVSQGEGERA
jgi:hypothetical protein